MIRYNPALSGALLADCLSRSSVPRIGCHRIEVGLIRSCDERRLLSVNRRLVSALCATCRVVYIISFRVSSDFTRTLYNMTVLKDAICMSPLSPLNYHYLEIAVRHHMCDITLSPSSAQCSATVCIPSLSSSSLFTSRSSLEFLKATYPTLS